MTEEELLALKIGGTTVAENIQHAVDAGHLVREPDGSLRLAQLPPNGNWATCGPTLGCRFLVLFLFPHIYARSAVPFGCRACYKVKVAPRTLRELVAAWGIGKALAYTSKWGVDLNNRYSQDIYSGYFYASGLENARAIYREVRALIDTHPLLGSDVAMSIKRGCTAYEAALGPSNEYTFAPELEELEAYLHKKFRVSARKGPPPLPLAHWIDVAYRVGDDTYLDFTQGKSPHPKPVEYEP